MHGMSCACACTWCVRGMCMHVRMYACACACACAASLTWREVAAAERPKADAGHGLAGRADATRGVQVDGLERRPAVPAYVRLQPGHIRLQPGLPIGLHCRLPAILGYLDACSLGSEGVALEHLHAACSEHAVSMQCTCRAMCTRSHAQPCAHTAMGTHSEYAVSMHCAYAVSMQ